MEDLWLGAGAVPVLGAAMHGVAAVWAESSRTSRLLRVAVVGLLLALWLFVPAHDAVLLYLSMTLPIVCVRRWTSWRRQVAEAGDAETTETDSSPARRWGWLDAVIGLVVIIALDAFISAMPKGCRDAWVLLVVGGILAGLLFLSLWAIASDPFGTRSRDRRGKPPLARWMRVGLGFYIALFLIPVVLIGLMVLGSLGMIGHLVLKPGLAPVAEELPEPNAYPMLLAVGHSLEEVEIPDADKALVSELDAFVRDHADAIGRIRSALEHEGRVTLGYIPSDQSSADEKALWRVARTLAAEAKLSALLARADEAATIHGRLLRLSQATTGGLTSHTVASDGFAHTAIVGLNGLVDKLSAECCEALVDQLEQLERSRDSVETIAFREAVWYDNTDSLFERFRRRLASTTPDLTGIQRNRVRRQLTAQRLMRATLAVHQFDLEHEQPLENLAQLVPEYLDALPEDPYADKGTPLKFEIVDEKVVLSSIGPAESDVGLTLEGMTDCGCGK